jgi:hypothetical protein
MAQDVQWEYCHIVTGANKVVFMDKTFIGHQAPEPISWYELGLGGWELVAVVGNWPYFKRQVQPGRAIDDVAKNWP